jgi:hypothetical protein
MLSIFHMKKTFITALLAGLATAASAQQWILPPSALLDGSPLRSIGVNAHPLHWENPLGFAAYHAIGDEDTSRLLPGVADSVLGLTWNHAIPAAFFTAQNQVTLFGGTMRVIFVGETAGGRNNFGYSRDGDPAGLQSYTIFSSIQAAGASPNITFGEHVDIGFAAGSSPSFDLWFNAVEPGRGGVYSLTDAAHLNAADYSRQFLWSEQTIGVSTWMPASGRYENVDTYLVSVEDLRLDANSDVDYSDFRIALQFFNASGEAIAAIPEPAHFAAAVGLASIVVASLARRRRSA